MRHMLPAEDTLYQCNLTIHGSKSLVALNRKGDGRGQSTAWDPAERCRGEDPRRDGASAQTWTDVLSANVETNNRAMAASVGSNDIWTFSFRLLHVTSLGKALLPSFQPHLQALSIRTQLSCEYAWFSDHSFLSYSHDPSRLPGPHIDKTFCPFRLTTPRHDSLPRICLAISPKSTLNMPQSHHRTG